MGHFGPVLGSLDLNLGHFVPISRALGLDSGHFQPIVEAYPGGYSNGLLNGFGPGGSGPAFGPISEVEILDWTILGVLGLDSAPLQSNAEVWAYRRGYLNGRQWPPCN